ncbi:LysM peptidoglycan-binding domain-containing protein [Streptomyces sp. KMM 9044]|uniref:LysM peptidoglycan-binding domain-containing protein n=1 Tax=Streptomyces sp. KMM 9044 TaxID=2744474 RepID=UPI003FA7125D
MRERRQLAHQHRQRLPTADSSSPPPHGARTAARPTRRLRTGPPGPSRSPSPPRSIQQGQGRGAWPTCSARAGASGSAPGAGSVAAGEAPAKPPKPAEPSPRSPSSNQSTQPKRSVPSKAPAQSPGGARQSSSDGDHTARAGDTLSAVAARHGTTWQQLHAANEAVTGGDPDVILPGQRLVL